MSKQTQTGKRCGPCVAAFMLVTALLCACGSDMADFAYDAAGSDMAYDSIMTADGAPADLGTADCTDTYCAAVCTSLGYASGACLPSGACSCSGETWEEEQCGDGLDNDGDGEVDESCACSPAESQPCYPGPAATRGVGICADGTQACAGDMEFYSWGPCTGAVLPAPEACDGLDNDCDGAVDEGCGSDCTYATEIDCGDGIDNDCDGLIDCLDPECPSCCVPSLEDCRNGLDDDCDGLIDCADPYCATVPEDCGNGVDDDCDGLVDCMDSQCPPCCVPTAENCNNGVDDDCDGVVDCSDSDCLTRTESCSNGVDDNCNGLVDCNDPQCPDCCPPGTCTCCVPGTWRWCDTPTYCSWGKQQCLPNSQWGYCGETSDRPPGCGSFYYDRSCCISAGACCQNYPYDETSVGTCDGVAAQCP